MDYSNGKIYTIRSFQTDKYYIGSTTTSLAKRFSCHKFDYKNGRSISSSEIVKFDDAYIELLEDYPCGSKNELNKREGQLIRQYKNECVNNNIAGRTDKEYNKQWRQKNKDKIKEYKKKWEQQNKANVKIFDLFDDSCI